MSSERSNDLGIFLKFNRRSIQDRQIDTLIGISAGLVADGKINQEEATFLMSWLRRNRSSKNPIILNLLEKVSSMLEDGVLDNEESAELLAILRGLAGGKAEVGEMPKSASLPIDNPMPDISFVGSVFVFTGTFVFGNRKECSAATVDLGGKVKDNVTNDTSYLILGIYVTDSWAHETYGRKIETAIKYRDSGTPLAIISEEHWVKQGGL